MTEVSSHIVLNAVFGKAKKDPSKMLRFSIGALAADADHETALRTAGADAARYYTTLREPPAAAAGTADKGAGGAKNAAEMQGEARALVVAFSHGMYFNADSPYHHGFLSYHGDIIQQHAGSKQAGSSSIITDTKNGEYPPSWDALCPGGHWNIELHTRCTKGLEMQRDAYPPIDGKPPTAMQVLRVRQDGQASASTGAEATMLNIAQGVCSAEWTLWRRGEGPHLRAHLCRGLPPPLLHLRTKGAA
jgi:hypothetical protein